jgi:hypothetical protein
VLKDQGVPYVTVRKSRGKTLCFHSSAALIALAACSIGAIIVTFNCQNLGFFAQRAIWGYSTVKPAASLSENKRAEWSYISELSGLYSASLWLSHKV